MKIFVIALLIATLAVLTSSQEVTAVAPPPPTTASPTTNSGTFTQDQCTTSTCTTGCYKVTFAQNACLEISGGGSAMATCGATTLKMSYYPVSSDCTGEVQPSEMPLDQCISDTDGFMKNTCQDTSDFESVKRVANKLSGDEKLRFSRRH